MGALRKMIDLSKADTERMLPASRVPALIVMGSRDPDFADPAAEAHWLAGQLTSEALIVDGAGHYPHLEMTADVAPGMLSFLARLS
jgi:pimeloyl-ACP methyl ester carboxylesterase